MRSFVLSVFLVAMMLLLVGCATTRNITITTKPPDANIKIDNSDRGRGRVVEPMVFKDKNDSHVVTVSRLGFKEQSIPLRKDYKGDALNVELKPLTRRVTFNVSPVAGAISVDGKQLAADAENASIELEFTVDARNNWTTHTVVAEHPGYEKVERVVSWTDKEPVYSLRLEPRKKNVTINSTPPGAQVTIDGEQVGVTPLTLLNRPFPVDPQTDEAVPQKVRLIKPGYDPVDAVVSWDDGKTDYSVDLAAKTKMVRVFTDPPGATVTIEGKALDHDRSGAALASLAFPPVDDKGTLRSYAALITKKTADSEWEPQRLTIGWENGKPDYSVALKEIKTRPVAMLAVKLQRDDTGWEATPELTTTLAMKDVTEGGKRQPPLQLTKVVPGTQIDTIAVSPDGTRLLFTILFGKDKANFRSQILAINTDGSGGADFLSDGKSLEITPSYTAGGDQIVFASNRAGRRLSVWAMSATGAPGVTQLTGGDTNDLWPSIDSDPKPRLFYQASVDTRPDPRIYMTQLGTTTRTDLTQMSGAQPRVSPRGDTVVFTSVNDKTGKRDIYLMPDRGGVPRNLTNTPDIDEFDPAWNKDGTRLAFVSDRGVDEDRRQNLDIWVMDISRNERPVQITTNGSWDDHPAWEPNGAWIYFRSNRGGDWAIWRISAK